MARHLITCDCGQQLAAETGQAGDLLRCTCGRSISVPAFRQLRALPVASESADKTAGTWGARQGTITLLALLAAAALVSAGYVWWSTPTMPEFNPEGWTRVVDSQIAALSPEDAWRIGTNLYQSLSTNGFTAMELPSTDAIRSQITFRFWLQLALVATAVICGAASVAMAATGRRSPPVA